MLRRIDAAVGALVTAARAALPGLVVAIASDHGFRTVARDINLYRPFEDAGLIRRGAGGGIADWQAMPWLMGGSAAVVLRRPDDAALLRQVGALLERLRRDRPDLVADVLGRADLDRLGAVPGAAFLVLLPPDAKTAWLSTAPLLAPSDDKGMHGFSVDDPAMAATLLLAGPGVPVGHDLGILPMAAVAPRLARLLGVAL